MGQTSGKHHRPGRTGPDLIKSIQRTLIDEYYFVPIYWNPFVPAVGPKVLPEGKGIERYWDTLHAPYPWPWEVWEVKG